MGSTWNEVGTVFGEEFRRATRRLAFRVMLLAVPIILLVLLIVAPVVRNLTSGDDDGEIEPGRIGLVDLSGMLPAEVPVEEGMRMYSDREEGVVALVADEIRALFIIPQDYLETGQVRWLHTSSTVSANVSGEKDTTQLQSWLRGVLVKDALRPEVATRFMQPAQFESLLIEEGGTTKEGPKEASVVSVSYIFAILLMMAVLTGSGYLLESVAEEKESRMIEVLLTSVSPLGLMAGKVLALGSAGLLQVTVWATSIAFMGPRILDSFPEVGQLAINPVMVVWLVAFFLAGYFVIGVTMAAIGAATTSYREGSTISLLVLLPAVAVPMVFRIVIVGDPEGGLARGLSYFPFTAPVTMMLRMGAADIPAVEVISSLAATILGGVIILWGSARVFRAGLLMYGQRMSLKRVFKALREAG
ncbi:MAG: ABC transporter permease [Dehalococcoidia bacterium]